MPNIKWSEVIPETLESIHLEIRGEKLDGSCTPSEDFLKDFEEHFKGKPTETVVEFLKECMYAYLAKTQKTRTPFYLKNILSKKNLDYIAEKGHYLREFYAYKIEPVQFSRMVYGAVFSSEMDYLDVIGGLWMRGKQTFPWDLLSPSPYWLIFSEHWDRFDKKTVDTWDSVTVEYGGKDVSVIQARARERTKMGDSQRFAYAKLMASEAMVDAAVDWATRLNFLHTSSNSSGKLTILGDSEMPRHLLDVRAPLLARDKALFTWAYDAILRRAQDVEGFGHANAACILEPVEPRPLGQLQRLMPIVAAITHDAHSDK